MDNCEHPAPAKCTTIKWGAILAGAAVVAGAVLLAPSLIPSVGTALQSVAEWIGAAFGGATTASLPAIAPETIRQVSGAALLGGGAAYLLGGSGGEKQAHYDHLAHDNRETFAMTEDMRKTQMKMMIQAAAAGNPQAQAMMAQMQGRGC